MHHVYMVYVQCTQGGHRLTRVPCLVGVTTSSPDPDPRRTGEAVSDRLRCFPNPIKLVDSDNPLRTDDRPL